MRKRFEGDATHVLPARRMEPYRLWFEFLKLAAKDPKLRSKIDRELYAGWDDFEAVTFDDWWATHWRQLFANPRKRMRRGVGTPKWLKTHPQSSIRQLHNEAEFGALRSDEIAVALPIYLSPRIARLETTALLRRISSHLNKRTRFRITSGAKLKLSAVRIMLRLYARFLEFGGDVDKVVQDYAGWAREWNLKKRRSAKGIWTAPMEFYVRRLSEIEELRRNRVRVSKREYPAWSPDIAYTRLKGLVEPKDPESAGKLKNIRDQITRYIRKGQRIAANVARGDFPGSY